MALDMRGAASKMIDAGYSDDDIRTVLDAVKGEASKLIDDGLSDAEIEQKIGRTKFRDKSGQDAPLFAVAPEPTPPPPKTKPAQRVTGPSRGPGLTIPARTVPPLDRGGLGEALMSGISSGASTFGQEAKAGLQQVGRGAQSLMSDSPIGPFKGAAQIGLGLWRAGPG